MNSLIEIRKTAMDPMAESMEDTELKKLWISRVDLVNKAANKKKFAIMKAEDAMFVCQSCGVTIPRIKLEKAVEIEGTELLCGCGRPIRIEKDETPPAEGEGEGEKKTAEGDGEGEKKEGEGEKKVEDKVEDKGEKSSIDKMLEALANLQNENESLRSKNSDLENKLAESENKLAEASKKNEELTQENAELEKLAEESLNTLDKHVSEETAA